MKTAFLVSSLAVAVVVVVVTSPSASAQNTPTKLTERIVNAEAQNQAAIAPPQRDPRFTSRYGAQAAAPAPAVVVPAKAPVAVPVQPLVATPLVVPAAPPQRDPRFTSRYGAQAAAPAAAPAAGLAAVTRPGVTAVPVPVAARPSREDPEREQRIINFQRQNAISGNSSAQYDVGMRFLKGDGLEQDEKQAKHWLELAAKAGNSRAKKQLAAMKTQLEAAEGTNKELENAAARPVTK